MLKIILPLILISCSSSKMTNNNARKVLRDGMWQQKTIVVDGVANEWNKSYMYFNKATNSAYSITNDKVNLYILLITVDEQVRSKILQEGMTLFIDPYGRKKEFVSVAFPLKASGDELPQADKFSVKGFKTGNGLWSLQDENTAGIKIKVGLSPNHDLIYEAVIPIKSFLREELITPFGRQLLIGFRMYGLAQGNVTFWKKITVAEN